MALEPYFGFVNHQQTLENLVKRFYYFLITGQILFKTANDDVGTVLVNAVVTNETSDVPSRLIGKAQQALQLNFFKMAEDPTAEVINVIITNWTSLGRMTETYFLAAPEGMKLQEVKADPAPVADDPFADQPATVN